VFPREPIRHTVVVCSISNHSIAANRITIFPCPYTVRNCSKIVNITDFSKTGSRNMAKTCAINFLILLSYSTSIVIGGLRRLLLPVLMWASVDLTYFAQNQQSAVLRFFPFFIIHYRKNRKHRETISDSLVESWVLYWYSLKNLLKSIYFADRWRCKCAIRALPRKHVQVGKFEHSSLPHRTS